MQRAYLIVVRSSEDGWIVDEDSYHNLESYGSNVLELQVQVIRPLASEESYENQGNDDQETAATA